MSEAVCGEACRHLTSFKAYDIRGRVPEELDAALAWRVGLAYAQQFTPRTVAIGRDVRPSGKALAAALASGLIKGGAEVIDIGLCATEEIYWAAQQPAVDGGIQITASHNPPGYNGMKLVRAGAIPVGAESGLRELETRVAAMHERASRQPASVTPRSYRADYAAYLLAHLPEHVDRRLKIVVDGGHGMAGVILDALAPSLPFQLVRLRAEPDPSFPDGVPNPLLAENRRFTADAVRRYRADLGVAWDGDADRCFLYDERGCFIESYYIVGLLARAMLRLHPGSRIVHDPRLTWNTLAVVRAAGGIPVQSRTGHAFVKERMRDVEAVYGGEMSGHHYFQDFAYCDNGSLPWLLVAGMVATSGQPLSSMVEAYRRAYPISGEINRRVADADAVLAAVEDRYAAEAVRVDRTDGLGVEFPRWRFNLRRSNTEPLLRLNVESRGDVPLMERRTAELLALIDAA